MKKLDLSPDLRLPLDAVTQTFAFLARRGAGKTYGASKLCEEMLSAGAQVVVLDPVGNWYGLRLGADGKGAGLSIPVFGGLRGDVPLEPHAGAIVADLVVDRGVSVVLDVSMFRKGDRKRFVTDFAEQLFHRKKEKRSPLHLFVEEAQVFVPQRVGPDEARMLGAMEDLVKLGRNFGIGVTLISQRPQAVNKDALTQTECLVVLQTNGAQERKALREWIVDQGLDVGDLVDSLPGLKKGEAWVWSPSWLGVTKRIHIGKKKTFNASATPEVGAKAEAQRELAPVDLEEIRGAMAAVIQEAEEKDPKALRRRVAEPLEQIVTVPALSDDLVERFTKAFDEMQRTALEVRRNLQAAREIMRPGTIQRRIEQLAAPRPAQAARVARETAAGDGELPAGERRMLEALARRLPTPLTRDQLGVLSGYAAGGGTFRTYLPALRRRGYVEETSDGIAITPEGCDAIGGAPPPQRPEEIREMWRAVLGAGERKMLDVLLHAYPESMDRAALGAMSGYAASGGTFRTYLPKLRRLGLVTVDGDEVRASESLFMEGR